MASTTANLTLREETTTETYDVAVTLNGNWDKIDAAFSASTLATAGAQIALLRETAMTPTYTASAKSINLTPTWNGAGATLYGVFLNVTNSASAAGSRLIDLQVGGVSQFSVTTAGVTAIAGATTVTSASASALTVGLAGATNPAFKVDASTASSATGIQVKSAAAAGGVAISVVSSGTNENLTIDAKGSGTITLGGTSTGAIVLTRAATLSAGGIVTTGGFTVTAGGATITAGNLGVNGAINARDQITVVGSGSNDGATFHGIGLLPTANAALTNALRGAYIQPATANSAFTVANVDGIYIDNPSKGAASTITNARGLYVAAQTRGATNNYGIYIEAPSGGATNNIGLYNAGTTTLAAALTVSAGGIAETGGGRFISGVTGSNQVNGLNLRRSDSNWIITNETNLRIYGSSGSGDSSTKRFEIDTAGIVSIGSPGSTSGAGAGEMVLANAKKIYGTNAAGSAALPMVAIRTDNFLELSGGYTGNALVIPGYASAGLPAAGAGNNGLFMIDTTNHRLCFYEGGNRYYLAGTSF